MTDTLRNPIGQIEGSMHHTPIFLSLVTFPQTKSLRPLWRLPIVESHSAESRQKDVRRYGPGTILGTFNIRLLVSSLTISADARLFFVNLKRDILAIAADSPATRQADMPRITCLNKIFWFHSRELDNK